VASGAGGGGAGNVKLVHSLVLGAILIFTFLAARHAFYADEIVSSIGSDPECCLISRSEKAALSCFSLLKRLLSLSSLMKALMTLFNMRSLVISNFTNVQLSFQ
jgi:hypothetical protein